MRAGIVLRVVLAGLVLASVTAYADDNSTGPSGSDGQGLRLSGFLTIAGGTVNGQGGELDTGAGIHCPCFVSDWYNGGIYQGSGFTIAPDSKVGVQANYTFTPNLSFTGQVTSHGYDPTPELQWAYFGYKLSPALELDLGRQRIDMYYYSQFEDVGFAYPWISTPGEVYGWQANDYDGASLHFKSDLAGFNLLTSVFAGAERVSGSLYYRALTPDFRNVNVNWNDMYGAGFEVDRDWLSSRVFIMHFNSTTTDFGPVTPGSTFETQSLYGWANNFDFDKLFILSEMGWNNQQFTIAPTYSVLASYYTAGAGYRLGQWTPFINYGWYHETTNDLALYSPGSYHTTSLILRYDLTHSSDLKFQIDRHFDTSYPTSFGGSATVLRISYDAVFY